MLIGLVEWLARNERSAELIVYASNPDELRYSVKARTVWSPECYFSQFLKQQTSPRPLWSLLIRIFAICRGLWFIANFCTFRLTGRCFIKNTACLGFYSQVLTAKALILAGGGYLNSVWWLDGLYSKAFPVILAKFANVPVLLTSQGLGPFNHFLDRYIAKRVFKNADIIGVRDDENSKAVVKGVGAQTSKVIHTGDDALLLKPEQDSVLRKILEAEKIPNAALIGVNLRDASSYSANYAKLLVTSYAQLLDEIVSQPGRHLVFIPISYNYADDDRKSAQQIVKAMRFQDRVTIIRKEYDASQLRGLIGRMNIAIGTSYHFLLFALSGNVPSVGVYQNEYYKQKLQGLFSLFGMQKYCLNMNGDDRKSAETIIEDLFQNNHEIIEMLKSRNEMLQSLSIKAHSLLRQKITRGFGNKTDWSGKRG